MFFFFWKCLSAYAFQVKAEEVDKKNELRTQNHLFIEITINVNIVNKQLKGVRLCG